MVGGCEGGWRNGGSLCCFIIIEGFEGFEWWIQSVLEQHIGPMRLARNLLSMVSSRLASQRRNRSWILSSDTLVGAKVVKGVILQGVLEVMTIAKASSTIYGGSKVTLVIRGSTTSTWGPRCTWRLLNNSLDSSFSYYCLVSASFCKSISWWFSLSCFCWS